MFFFGVVGYTYLVKDNNAGSIDRASLYEPKIAGSGLRNSMVFTWAFLEMVFWFWVSPPACYPGVISLLNAMTDLCDAPRRAKRGSRPGTEEEQDGRELDLICTFWNLSNPRRPSPKIIAMVSNTKGRTSATKDLRIRHPLPIHPGPSTGRQPSPGHPTSMTSLSWLHKVCRLWVRVVLRPLITPVPRQPLSRR